MERWKPFLLLGTAQGVRAFQTLVQLIVFARFLGPEGLGEAGLAMTMAQLLLPLFDMGNLVILVREFAREEEHSREWLAAAVMTKIVVAILLLPVSWGLSWIFDGGMVVPALSVAFTTQYLFRIMEPYEFWAIGKKDYLSPAIARIGGLIASTVPVIAMLYAGWPVFWCALASSIGFGVYSILIWGLVSYQSKSPLWMWRPERKYFEQLMSESWFLILSGLAQTVYFRLDVLFLTWFHGNEAVGIYLAATRFTMGMFLLPYIVADTFYPRLVVSGSSSGWQRLMNLEVFFAIMSILGFIFGAPLLPWIVGEKFEPSVNVLRIHINILLAGCTLIVCSKILVSEGRQRYMIHSSTAGMVANIVFNLLLIPRWSVTGAAIAACLSHFTGAFVVFLAIRETRELAFMQLRSLQWCCTFWIDLLKSRSAQTTK